MTNKTSLWDQMRRHAHVWLNRRTLANRLVTILIGVAALCGLMTYAALTNVPPFGNSSSGLIILLNVNLVLLLTLVVLVSRRIIALYIRRKRGIVGSNLHIRLVFIFSLLAALPAMFMAIFSVVFFYFGLHGWLDDRVRTAINESQAVAQAYLYEHQQLIRADVLGLASDLDRQASLLAFDNDAMTKMLKTQALLRNFSNIHLVRSDSSVVSQAVLDPGFSVGDILIPDHTGGTDTDDVLVREKGQEGITALIKLSNYLDTYVYVERDIDPKVLGHVERAGRGVAQYRELQQSSTRLQILISIIYLLITLLLTVAAIWFGLSFARKLMRPITDLINASDQAGQGDLSVRVDPSYALDEFKMLGQAFNRMTETIETQQFELVDANKNMDFRRRFTETILGGVSTGVLSVDEDRKITLANNASGDLLQCPISELIGQKIMHIMPEIAPHLEQAFEDEKHGSVLTCEIKMRLKDNAVRIFMARIVIEIMTNNKRGAIITFDDLTTVLANQRKAAWADVARRIAHEIKNPLTPIQLSAERLNRKYAKTLDGKDKETFDQCTETIIRHVNDIKTMVNSFAEFAKMPDADIRREDIWPVIREVYTLQKEAHQNIDFDLITDQRAEALIIAHDEQQIRQVLTNLIKNAVEAIDDYGGQKRIINMIITQDKGNLIIGVTDTGVGLPDHVDTDKLSEPYITHKAKGTGLGLAIVKKIVEDHHGRLMFNPDLPIIMDMSLNYRTLIAFTIPLGEQGQAT